jgi:hypothetical protein
VRFIIYLLNIYRIVRRFLIENNMNGDTSVTTFETNIIPNLSDRLQDDFKSCHRDDATRVVNNVPSPVSGALTGVNHNINAALTRKHSIESEDGEY